MLALLRLQIEWGADEALADDAIDRLAARPAIDVPARAPLSRPPLASTAPATQARGQLSRGQVAQAQAAADAADSVPALLAAIRDFTGCPLRDTAGHTLLPEGDPGSGLLLVGEIPDAEEDRAGHAFAGAPGALLDRMLGSIGLARENMLRTPLIPWRPPGDRKVSALELATCLPFLFRLVALARPQRLVLLGVRPTRVFAGEEQALARLRGRWREVAVAGLDTPVPVLPMRHPSHLLANPLARREAWQDLLLLRTTLDADRSQ
ncbi:uracil-DNA glycosylase [Lichenicoccus roseus]|uniref:Type-4 uracil-DNA glycosylase n=2 Tax=Lichenicoccus roseus TaxID=2683649 RepID=A0A5R9J7J1_9PROT|nr:uracil-DNA glycosylase [Lichenicoccus roseus]